jgi:hypothetical protein
MDEFDKSCGWGTAMHINEFCFESQSAQGSRCNDKMNQHAVRIRLPLVKSLNPVNPSKLLHPMKTAHMSIPSGGFQGPFSNSQRCHCCAEF